MTTYKATGADGSTVNVTYNPPPVPVTTPDPTPVPVSTPSTGRHRMIWHNGWNGPALTSYPSDVLATLDTVMVDMCQSAQAGTGLLANPPGVTKAAITALVGGGIDVFLGVGGAGNGGITITTPAQVAQAQGSINAMRDAYGVTGVTFDLEGDPGNGWNAASMITLTLGCVAAGLKVGMWSALYSGRLTEWGAVAKALGAHLHHWERGFYDFPEARDTRLTGIVTSNSVGLAAMRPYVVSDDQLVASFMPTAAGDANTSPIPVITAAYANVTKTLYGNAGWSVYDDAIEAGNGWAATRALAKL